MSKKKKKTGKACALPSRHAFYEAAVQNVGETVPFMRNTFKKLTGRKPFLLREDFCGTMAVSCEWVRKGAQYEAWGIDLDQKTLNWGVNRNVETLGKEAMNRVHILHGDVRKIHTPPVDLAIAQNFSYFTFKERSELLEYFTTVKESLKDDGVFIIDIFGGTEAMTETVEKRWVSRTERPDGTSIPKFKYIWEHRRFNAIDHHLVCDIHFKIPKKGTIERAFTYDWRLWTIPEVRDVMWDAGFDAVDIFIHGWTSKGECDDAFKRRREFENAEGWLAYIAAARK